MELEHPQLVASLTEPLSASGEEVRRLSGVASWLELRADLVGDVPAERLRELFAGRLIYTLRSRAEGGAFAAARERRRKRIEQGSPGFDLVDLEGERDLGAGVLREIAPERRLISWHGAAADAHSLRARLEPLLATPAALYKLVPHATTAGEDLAVIELLTAFGRSDVVAFATGLAGFWTRIVAPRFGSRLIFGSVGPTPAAAGQPTIDRLVGDWGLPALPPASRLFGVVGKPALRSLSPRLHQAAYRELGIDALYVPFEIEHFGDFWLELVEGEQLARAGLPIAGLSVTSPYKEIAFAVAGAASPLAERLQAANTLVRPRGVWEAESTDAEGVVAALVAAGVEPRGRRTAVVGCGGAGRAAALGLAMGGAEVAIVNRGAERGLDAARALRLPFVPLDELDPSRFDLFVHATPLGRDGEEPAPLPLEGVAPGAVVIDLVYGEAPTALVVAARERGLLAIDGREVLLHQAAPQFLRMTGRELPVGVARRALGLEGGEAA